MMTTRNVPYDKRTAWLAMLAGVVAAAHVGKLPPAIPAIKNQMGFALDEVGLLLGIVQFAGMFLGMLLGLGAGRIGLRRALILGLTLQTVAGLVAAGSVHLWQLMLLRALEGLGFLFVSLTAPSIIRRSLSPEELPFMMGVWGAYVPFGMALAMLIGPAVVMHYSWEILWWVVSACSGVVALGIFMLALPDEVYASETFSDWRTRLSATVRTPIAWLLGATFMVYSAQWMTVTGFMPLLLIEELGFQDVQLGVLSALVLAMNIVGNIAAGYCIQHGVRARLLLWLGFSALAVATFFVFAEVGQGAWGHYAGMLAFSAFGGLIPGALFVLLPRVTPQSVLIPTTLGLMMQGSATGQLMGPAVVGSFAMIMQGWQYTWWVTGVLCALGVVFATLLTLHRTR